MAQIGYKLACEEHGPTDLVAYARHAEEAGFTFAMISDHFHPWIDRQGQAPFVWSVIGGIAQTTRRLRVGTGVTCPTIRTHPAIIAHAAATVAAMMPGRFMLGLGSGENLNEHILGGAWPSAAVRRDMLVESVEVIRLLWRGGFRSHHGRYFTVENARLYTLPEQLPPILLAAGGERAAALAGEIADGLICVGPRAERVQTFAQSGGAGKPTFTEVNVCWAEDEAEARRIAHTQWPIAGLKGELAVELPLPRHFEQAARLVSEKVVAENVPCGPDPARHRAAIQRCLDAGFDHVWIHQIGPDQHGFFEFYQREVLPAFR